jgi:hypothetical protein
VQERTGYWSESPVNNGNQFWAQAFRWGIPKLQRKVCYYPGSHQDLFSHHGCLYSYLYRLSSIIILHTKLSNPDNANFIKYFMHPVHVLLCKLKHIYAIGVQGNKSFKKNRKKKKKKEH